MSSELHRITQPSLAPYGFTVLHPFAPSLNLVTTPHKLFVRDVKGHLVMQSEMQWCKNIMDFHTQDRWKVDPGHTGDCKYLLPVTKVPAQTKLDRLNITSKSKRQSSTILKKSRQGQSRTQGEFERGYISWVMTTILEN